MNSLVIPGLQFYAEPMVVGESRPQKNELYVVCMDLSIQSVHEPNKIIGWRLIDDGDSWYYTNPEPAQCLVRFHGVAHDIPKGSGFVDEPQNAEVIFQMDNDPEVSSY